MRLISKITKILFWGLFITLYPSSLKSQIVINGAAIININGGISGTPSYLVLNTPPATPITTLGTTGGIMMESEYNITRYNLGLLTTPITVPYFSFNSGTGVQFPLGVSGISGAAGAGNLQFSSKHAPVFASGFDNATYLPSDVTNMNGWIPVSTYTTDNSPDAIDRFWIIDALGYTTSPAVTYNFGYITAEGNANGGNILTVSNLQAEPFERIAGVWAGQPTYAYPSGVNSTGATEGNVSSVNVGAGLIGTHYRSWTLVDHTSPLPVSLLNFTGICASNSIRLDWSTASESNSSYFRLEKSLDGENFSWLADIPAAGNSVQEKKYSYADAEQATLLYYSLTEVDKNGQSKPLGIISSLGCKGGDQETFSVYSGNGNFYLNVYSLLDQSIQVTIYDMTGRKIYTDAVSASKGKNNFILNPSIASGIYLLEATTSLNSFSKRVPLLK